MFAQANYRNQKNLNLHKRFYHFDTQEVGGMLSWLKRSFQQLAPW